MKILLIAVMLLSSTTLVVADHKGSCKLKRGGAGFKHLSGGKEVLCRYRCEGHASQTLIVPNPSGRSTTRPCPIYL